MIWVGGSIILHALDQMGWPVLYAWVHHVAVAAAEGMGDWAAAVEWGVTAALDGVFGLALGLLLIPVAVKIVQPLWARLRRKS